MRVRGPFGRHLLKLFRFHDVVITVRTARAFGIQVFMQLDWRNSINVIVLQDYEPE
jgi:hypothetical protein